MLSFFVGQFYFYFYDFFFIWYFCIHRKTTCNDSKLRIILSYLENGVIMVNAWMEAVLISILTTIPCVSNSIGTFN